MQYERYGVPFDDVVRSRFIFGSAIEVAEQVRAFRDLGVGQFVLWHEPPFDSDAEDQIRGEAATLAFFSQGQFTNPMVLRVAGLPYQKGFGGHFHKLRSG